MSSAKKMVAYNMKDEKSAALGYAKLAKELRKKGLKRSARVVEGIMKQEKEHDKKLAKIRKEL